MRLKKIEILGFKSFREKTSLLFSPGISAIVGPNGCGKSNIVDAMRWVMGEQRITTLRGKKMEDVIFNGSDDAKPVSMAHVSITFENNGRQFNGSYAEFAEVTVSRKLYRDGESEYSINNVPCRLLDVREFFMDAGVGSRTYSIVEQERVFRLIESKPEDRREFIEEAAGIAKYRSRKESASRKMEATRQNLLRLNDIVSEVKSRLNALSRQAKKAERFKTLKQSVRESQLALSLDLLLGLKSREEALKGKIDLLEEQRMGEETRRTVLEASIEEIHAGAVEAETSASTAQEGFFTIRNDITTLEQSIVFSRKTRNELEHRRTVGNSNAEALRSRRRSVTEEIKALETHLSASEESMDEIREDMNRLQGIVERLAEEETATAETLEREKSRHFDTITEQGRLKNLLVSLEKDLETLKRKKERESREIKTHQGTVNSLRHRAAGLKADLTSEMAAIDRFKEQGQAGREELEGKRRELAAVDDAIEDLKERLGLKTSRLCSLKEIQERFDWCSEGTRFILKESRKDSWQAGRIYGLVADQLDVPREYEVAVEAVLGEKIQSILVEDHENGIRAIDYLKHSGSGRGSFIPLEDGRQCESPEDIPEHLGPVLRLTDIVSARSEDMKKFIQRLFGDILLIPDLHMGTQLWKKNGFTGTFVTPEGDIISGRGILTGGSDRGSNPSLLRSKREISELQRDTDGLREHLKEEHAVKAEIVSSIDSLEEELERLRKVFHEKEILVSEKKKDVERIEGEISWVEQQMKVLTFNRESMEREEAEAGRRIIESKDEMTRNEARISSDRDRIAGLQEQWKDISTRLKKEQQALTDRKIGLSSLEERREAGLTSLRTLQNSVDDIETRITAAVDEMQQCREKIRTALREESAFQERLAVLYDDFEKAERELSSIRDRHSAIETSRREAEALLQAARNNLDGTVRELNRLTLERHQATMQCDTLKAGVRERYQQDLQDMVEGFEPLGEERRKDIEKRLADDRARLDDFGDVNLLALSEYEELKERHDFLTGQVSDLETSLETLRKTIYRINQISRKRFAETFEGVNACFKQVFPRLFPGGKGSLHLTDERDMLETGVDIEIQIPGKKTQNLSLLSGGEKALAAVALIFSILMYRPTPFLVLDEADAPLDDSNVSLFVGMVGEIARESQVIYITHNKRTMETADNLIGVTMQKSGISTIVSVSMN
ncbi:MAG: chromosome segregation protein SMC [Syntrophales bacterium]|jgi:chromosome segregation protein|nr:chromosome segregation protein SMC [Syntrophales bacterium]MCK9527846.1 chromosome segregation protein SMC [Syntrophales bacterium]MDX9922056.1 chromosome segregation protein SMC [Syntrophales bacterium]